jgi:hypothetical protein
VFDGPLAGHRHLARGEAQRYMSLEGNTQRARLGGQRAVALGVDPIVDLEEIVAIRFESPRRHAGLLGRRHLDAERQYRRNAVKRRRPPPDRWGKCVPAQPRAPRRR